MRHIFKKYLIWLKRRIFTYDTIELYSVNPKGKHLHVNDDIVIKYVTESNVGDARYFQSESYIHIFREFLQKGDVGYYGYIYGKCVHRIWVVLCGDVTVHTFYQLKLRYNQVFIHWAETAENGRGYGVFPAALRKIQDDNTGREVLISVNADNLPSRKGLEKAGFTIKERIKIVMILGILNIRVQKVGKISGGVHKF